MNPNLVESNLDPMRKEWSEWVENKEKRRKDLQKQMEELDAEKFKSKLPQAQNNAENAEEQKNNSEGNNLVFLLLFLFLK